MKRDHGTPHRTGLPALPPRRPEAVPEGHALRHPQVRRRAPRRRPGHAPVPPGQAERVLDPPPREAEGQAVLRHLRAPVPQVLRHGQPPPGQHRRRPDVADRASARQRRHPARLRHQPRRRPGRSSATATSRSTAASSTSRATWSGPATRRVKDREHSKKLAATSLEHGRHAAGARLARPHQHRAARRPRLPPARPPRISRCRSPRS